VAGLGPRRGRQGPADGVDVEGGDEAARHDVGDDEHRLGPFINQFRP
jgi:hypothetical protein